MKNTNGSKKKSYRHLTYSDRLTIERMRLSGKFTVKDIAAAIGCSVRTIYYELKRSTYEHTNPDLSTEIRYNPDGAEQRYRESLKHKGIKSKLLQDEELKRYVEYMISEQKYSPEAVLHEIKQSELHFDVTVKSPNTIYAHIRKGTFPSLSMKSLPRGGKYKKHKKVVRVQKRASRGTSIEKRPEEVLERKEFGNWEMDCVIGKKSNKKTLLVLTERKTRYEIIEVLKAHNPEEVIKALNRIEKRLGSSFYKIFKSITVDNGQEFNDWAGMEKAVNRVGKRTNVYYCHPYSPEERGTNENNNQLVRRHFYKYSDFDSYVTRKKVKAAEEWINFYPRGIFDGKCSFDLFQAELEEIGCKKVISDL